MGAEDLIPLFSARTWAQGLEVSEQSFGLATNATLVPEDEDDAL
jgi:hypothetical protein